MNIEFYVMEQRIFVLPGLGLRIALQSPGLP